MSDAIQPKAWRQAMLSRLFHLYFRLKRPMTLGVRALAFNDEGHVFLVRHTYVPGWHLPGGGIEPGETALESLHRELQEEGNLIASTSPRLIGFYFNRRASKRDHVTLYVLDGVKQTASFTPNGEIAEARFFALDDLPQGVTPATQRRLHEFQSGAEPDPFW
jgi:8-oxo-dGTP pyrophosphatase MutT (NUDIX family)